MSLSAHALPINKVIKPAGGARGVGYPLYRCYTRCVAQIALHSSLTLRKLTSRTLLAYRSHRWFSKGKKTKKEGPRLCIVVVRGRPRSGQSNLRRPHQAKWVELCFRLSDSQEIRIKGKDMTWYLNEFFNLRVWSSGGISLGSNILSTEAQKISLTPFRSI